MAETITENISKTRSEINTSLEKEYSEKLTPEQKKKVLEEYEKINIKLKEAEFYMKRKKPYKYTFKGLEFFKHLNGHSVVYAPSSTSGKDNKKDKNESLENIWNQVDSFYKVSFEEMEEFLNPAMKEMFLNKCFYDRDLTRDVLGMTKVLKFVREKQYDRALAAMLYFGIEDRMHEMEAYFNINLGSVFKDKVGKTYEDIKELGLNEYQVKEMARTNMKASNAMVNKSKAAISNILTNSNKSGMDVAIATTAYSEKAIMNLPDILSGSRNYTPIRVPLTTKFIEDTYSMPGYGNRAERITAACEIDFYIQKINQRIRDLWSKKAELSRKIKTAKTKEEKDAFKLEMTAVEEEIEKNYELSNMLSKLPRFKHIAVVAELKKMEELIEQREQLAKTGKKEEIELIDLKIKVIKETLTSIFSGKIDVRGMSSYGEIERIKNKEPGCADRFIEICLRYSMSKNYQDNLTNELMLKLPKNVSPEDLILAIRKSGVPQKKVMESIRLVEKQSEISVDSTAKLATIKLAFNEYVRNKKQRRPIFELYEDYNSENLNKKKNAINPLIEQLYELVTYYSNYITIEKFEEIKQIVNGIKDEDVDELIKVKFKKIKEGIQTKENDFKTKKQKLEKTDLDFEELKSCSDKTKYIELITSIYADIEEIPLVFKVDYLEEELSVLQQKFDYCEDLIKRYGLKGDAGFEKRREEAKSKIDKMKTRKKLNVILDPTDIILAKSREETISLLRAKLKEMIGFIKSGKLPEEENRHVKRVFEIYKTIKDSNMTQEDSLEDIEEMFTVVENWSKNIDEKKFSSEIEELKTKIFSIKECKSEDEKRSKLLECKKLYIMLIDEKKVHPELLAEVSELYKQIEPEVLKVEKEEVKLKISKFKEDLLKIKDSKEPKALANLKKLRKEFEVYYEKEIELIDFEQACEVTKLIEQTQKELEERSKSSAASSEQEDSKLIRLSALNLLKKLKDLQSKEWLGYQEFEAVISEYEQLKGLVGFDKLSDDIKTGIEKVIQDLRCKIKIAGEVDSERIAVEFDNNKNEIAKIYVVNNKETTIKDFYKQ